MRYVLLALLIVGCGKGKDSLGEPDYVMTVEEFLKADAGNPIERDKKYEGKTVDLIGEFRGFVPKELLEMGHKGSMGSEYIFTIGGRINIYGQVDSHSEDAFRKLKGGNKGEIIRVRFLWSKPGIRSPFHRLGRCILIDDAK